MSRATSSFRVGRVQAYLRGRIWYLYYHEQGKRHRPRVGPDRHVARQLAAQINGQLQVGAPAALSFEPMAIDRLRERWLEHHELVLRSSLQTINRYRTATEHLLRFIQQPQQPRQTAQFHARHAEDFVRYLRSVEVAPNGHPRARKRPLLDKGVKYILECCRALFSYAAKRRHLSPYAENPFAALELDRIPLENSKPVVLFSPVQEQQFLEACDDWQFPLFLTLMLTGLRPGELTHLLLPEELDLQTGMLHVRNKTRLGWPVKTRNERSIPLLPILIEVLRRHCNGRTTGPVFRRRRFTRDAKPILAGMDRTRLEQVLAARIEAQALVLGRALSRSEQQREARGLWRDLGAVKTDRVRREFIALAERIGLAAATAPKMLRHLFATGLQDANVDPLIRNELMGHAPAGSRAGGGLGMTGHYTHTRPETRRKQLEAALSVRPALAVAAQWLQRNPDGNAGLT